MNRGQPTIGFIGIGLVGRALGLALNRQGYRVNGMHSRTLSSARDAAAQLRDCQVYGRKPKTCVMRWTWFSSPLPTGLLSPSPGSFSGGRARGAVHCCGAMSVEALAPAAAQGALAGAFHPCQTFAGAARPEQAVDRLKGCDFRDFGGRLAARLLARYGLPVRWESSVDPG